MKISRTYNTDVIRGILTAPGIWEAISDESQSREDFCPPLDGIIYLIDDKAVGLFVVHKCNGLWLCHVQVIPDSRPSLSMEFGRKVVEWVWDNTDINMLNATIPKKYPNVKKFAISQGFTECASNGSEWALSIKRNK